MGKADEFDDYVRGIERLSIPDDEKAFLIEVRRQYEYEAELAADWDTQPVDQ